MMFCRLGVLNAFLSNDTFNLRRVCWDVTPLKVEEEPHEP